jgi:hypothetical protein
MLLVLRFAQIAILGHVSNTEYDTFSSLPIIRFRDVVDRMFEAVVRSSSVVIHSLCLLFICLSVERYIIKQTIFTTTDTTSVELICLVSWCIIQ